MIRYLTCSFLAAAVLFGQTPAHKAAAPVSKSAAPAKKAAPVVEQIPLPSEPGQYAIFNTTMGRIIVRLYSKESPITVANFVALARGGKLFTDEKTHQPAKRPFYNGLTFHRVIPKFMIQGGDPTGTGMGGNGVPTIRDEFDPSLSFNKGGLLAMANIGQPNTGACQFFITTSDSLPSHLTGKHTIFGEVVEGQDVVDAISNVPTNPENNKPLTPVLMKTVLIRRVGPPPAPAPAPAKATGKAPAKTKTP